MKIFTITISIVVKHTTKRVNDWKETHPALIRHPATLSNIRSSSSFYILLLKVLLLSLSIYPVVVVEPSPQETPAFQHLVAASRTHHPYHCEGIRRISRHYPKHISITTAAIPYRNRVEQHHCMTNNKIKDSNNYEDEDVIIPDESKESDTNNNDHHIMARKKRRKTHNHGNNNGGSGNNNINKEEEEEEVNKLMMHIEGSGSTSNNNTTTSTNTTTAAAATQPKGKNRIPPISTINGMKLEAIFHPKFENENRTTQKIRHQMKSKVESGDGYLEVSLKHSGSLVLWSGYDYYYSKNSTCNMFTMTGELLLRQHFYRMYTAMMHHGKKATDGMMMEVDNEHDENHDDDDDPERFYNECSDYIIKHRLTLAFEVVTSVLGDHGDIPNMDFVMLTAIACRKGTSQKNKYERFYTTTEVIEFCQKFHLPHNDIWCYTNIDSVNALFELYDGKEIRENGYATTTIEALSNISQTHVSSVYPHSIYQGEILEGFIIRYVPYAPTKNSSSNGTSLEDETMQRMEQLAKQSQLILENVPPTTVPPCFELVKTRQKEVSMPPPVFTRNIRDVYKESMKTSSNSKGNNKAQQNQDNFASALAKILEESDNLLSSSSSSTTTTTTRGRKKRPPRRKVTKISTSSNNSNKQGAAANWDLPSLTQHLTTNNTIGPLSSSSLETMRIANLIQNLRKLRKAVNYALFYEETTSNDNDGTRGTEQEDEEGNDSGGGVGGRGGRWICVIHVLHDTTFQKYAKQMKVGIDMPLFRGFSVELSSEPFLQEEEEQDDDNEMESEGVGDEGDHDDEQLKQEEKEGEETLMLKMKLLPYMVRTFICRNNLRLLRQSGPDAFCSAAATLFDRWGISDEGKDKWMPFFAEWATYATNCFNGVKSRNNSKNNNNDDELPPLTESCYLKHLEHFTKLYESGELIESSSGFVPTLIGGGATGSTGTPSFRGMVIVVAVDGGMAQSVAKFLAGRLGGAHVLPAMDAIKRRQVAGVVMFVPLNEFGRDLRSSLDAIKSYSSLVVVGCNEPDIDETAKSSTMDEKEVKKLKGFAKSLRKVPCGKFIELSRSSLPLNDDGDDNFEDPDINIGEELQDCLNKIQEVSKAAPQLGPAENKKQHQPGLLIFFPGIPGCGKSTLVGDMVSEELCRRLSRMTLSDGAEEAKAGTKMERKLVIRVGDQIKKKFWPMLTKDRQKDPSCICIADKNAPAPSWNIVGDSCSNSRGIPVPVLPDSASLETTSINGVIEQEKSVKPNLEHFYPFSLSYLAVCMARVLERPKGSHQGNLDSGTEHACMIVIMFYSLYRNIAAEDFSETLKRKLTSSGALEPPKNVELSFFADANGPELPSDLQDTLIDALKFQYGYDLKKKKIKPSDKTVQAMEKRLRDSIAMHRDFLLGVTVPRDISQNQFLDQIVDIVSNLESSPVSVVNKKPIKIVSIDVDQIEVHKILHQARDSVSKEFLTTAYKDQSESNFTDGKYAGRDFVPQTHVTMAHRGNTSPPEMRKKFGGLIGCKVELKVKGLLWSDRVAALSVEIGEKTSTGVVVPSSTNEFTHITIWHIRKASAVEANKLPSQVDSGKAHKVAFESPFVLTGTFSYWDNANRPFKDEDDN